MGLDQYAYKVKRDYNHGTLTETITKTEIGYWRKHNALEGWMCDLYEKQGGEGEFNCKKVTLDKDDLDKLEKAVVEKKLPETVGFFFGNCTKDNEEYRELDLQFIKKARRCLENGWQVEYTSWW